MLLYNQNKYVSTNFNTFFNKKNILQNYFFKILINKKIIKKDFCNKFIF